MAERKSFNIGGCEDLHTYRRDAEDKLAACFDIPDRKGINKRRIYEFLWTEIHNAPLPLVRRAIAVLRGER